MPASTTTWSGLGQLMTVVQINRLCSKVWTGRAVTGEVLRVVGVHKDVGADLQLAVDTAGGCKFKGASTGAGDGGTLETVVEKQVAGERA